MTGMQEVVDPLLAIKAGLLTRTAPCKHAALVNAARTPASNGSLARPGSQNGAKAPTAGIVKGGRCVAPTSDCANSLSWCGKRRSMPPVWMSMLEPRMSLAITEHSMCQPGRPCATSDATGHTIAVVTVPLRFLAGERKYTRK